MHAKVKATAALAVAVLTPPQRLLPALLVAMALASSAVAMADLTPGTGSGQRDARLTAATGTTARNVVPSSVVFALVVDPRRHQTVYAATDDGVWKSTDAARSWQAVNTGLTAKRVDALAIDPDVSAVAYAGTGLGVFKTSDGGRSWRAVNSGLAKAIARDRLAHRLAEGFVYALAVDPRAPRVVYAGTSRGLYKSTNSGHTWRASGFAKRWVDSLAIDPQNSQTLYAISRGGVFKSTDGGRNWRPADGGNENLARKYSGASLVIDPQNAGTVYAGSWGHGVFKSTDGARTWRAVGLAKLRVGLLVFGPVGEILYAVTWPRGVYQSNDAGESWKHVLTSKNASAFAVDPQDSRALYAGTSLPGAVFKSSDGGATWQP
jgi:photosystem II stability/assembly factor-like uncharacterized protein